MATDEVPSVSVTIDHESRKLPSRHSLQPKSTPLQIPHRARSASSIGRSRPQHHHNIKKPSVPDIPETEKSEEDEPEIAVPAGTADSTRISFTRKSRKVSNISKASKRSSVERSVVTAGTASGNGTNGTNGYVNQGFINTPSTYAQSTRSSSIHGSMTSLPVMREQYCCCQRWTRMEKYLALIVAFLAVVIIGLIIAVGVVANHTDTPIDKYFMTLKF